MKKFDFALIAIVSISACFPGQAQDSKSTCIILRDDAGVVTRQLTVISGERNWTGGLSFEDYRPDENIMQFSDIVSGEPLEIEVNSAFRISVTRQVERSNPTAQSVAWEIVAHDEGEATVKIPLSDLSAKDGVLFGGSDQNCASGSIGESNALGLRGEFQFGISVFEANDIKVDGTGESLTATGQKIRYEKIYSGGGSPLDGLGINKGG